MQSLFSDAGAQRLDEALMDGRLLCAFDFDGTLAPIVTDPEGAGLPEDIRQRLLGLARYAPLAIITGRAVDDIRGRLGFEPDFLVGNHGMEGVPGWEAQAAQHEALCASWREQLGRALRDPGYDTGITLEDKRFSLSVHYRQVRDPEQTRRKLSDLFAKLDPQPRAVGGKFVFNLMTQDACHKGGALERLIGLTGAGHALYVGDDVTDEDVFRLRRSDLVSIRIEQSADSAAEFYLPGPQDIVGLLDDLYRRLRARDAVNWVRRRSAQ